jgi:hypothetical protein
MPPDKGREGGANASGVDRMLSRLAPDPSELTPTPREGGLPPVLRPTDP